MKILVACEESQTITKAFRELGHEAYSCDLQPCSGGHPEWHFQDDALKVAAGWFDGDEVTINDNFALKLDVYSDENEYEYDGDRIREIGWEWDMMIAHPPCTYLSVSGARWMYHPEDKDLPFEDRRPHPMHPNRRAYQREGLEFVQALMDAPIPRIMIENPVSVISSQIRKPDQIIQPFHFGDEARKTTCLWLKNLPKLEHTNVVSPGGVVTFKSGKSMSKWHHDTFKLSAKERGKARSKTFPGIAKAIAEQWGNLNGN